MSFRADSVATRFVEVGSVRYAYRRIGASSDRPPLVMCMRFRGVIDQWDPALLDALSAHREVIVFDNVGIGESSGTPSATIDGMAEGAAGFIDALGLREIDLLGWSMGGYVAIGLALARPDVARRLIVAGSAPGGVPDMPAAPDDVFDEVAVRPVNTDDDFLYLFFPDTESGRAAGLTSLRRMDTRLAKSNSVASPDAVTAQLRAFGTFAGYWDRLHELTMPVLFANGSQDIMIHPFGTYSASLRLPHAKIMLYSDAGHAFLFQHIVDFAGEVARFLD